MKRYRIIHQQYKYNPRASYFLLQRKKHWWSRWKTLFWYDYNQGELAYSDLETYRNKKL